MENRETQMERYSSGVDVPSTSPSPTLLSEQQEKALVPYSQACQIILRSLQRNREIDSQDTH